MGLELPTEHQVWFTATSERSNLPIPYKKDFQISKCGHFSPSQRHICLTSLLSDIIL